MDYLRRTWAMAVKELQVVLLDSRVRLLLVVAPILQLALFGMAATLDVTNIDLDVVNRDNGIASQRLLAGLGGSRNVRALIQYENVEALNQAIEHRKIIAGMVLPPDLSLRVAQGQTGTVGVLMDGRRINSAQIISGYLAEIAQQTGIELRPQSRFMGPQVLATHWFNPSLNYMWFTMPGLIAVIVLLMVFTVSGLSVSRERELGSFDELMILPLDSVQILAGKVAPAFLVGLFNAVLYLVLIPLVFKVPFEGSLLLLFGAMLAYALAITGIGLTISCLAQNQQQSFLGGFLVLVPLILISGYASPVDNMPNWLQLAAKADPIAHMLVICEGLFLKDIPASMVWPHIWPMLLIASVTLTLAGWLFRARSG